MDFSNQWRSLWPISSAFAAPNLLSAGTSKPLGPLLFHPSPRSPRLPPLVSSPSLALQIELPLPSSSLLDGLHTFFRAHDNDAFVPSAAEDSIAADVLSSFPDPPTDPIHTNNLQALRCRDGSTLALFFPTGPNADSIGFLTLSFKGGKPEVRVAPDGDIFKQTEGFKHPYHRIFKMSLSPAPANPMLSGNSPTEGFLLATTMYSVNWFRVETSDDQEGQPLRPSLIPVAKQGFDSAVVHACWSPHFPEESAALLDNGDLCWFNLNTKRGGTVRVALGETEPGEWLSCEFGGQPWIIIIACSAAVVSVDLRLKTETTPKFLARFDMTDSWSIAPAFDENEPFIAFCKSGFSDFHVAVVSKNHLFLFDTREPLVPVLKWDHGLERPSYVSMFRLSELRPPSDEFQWASESGFAILVGSFWDDEFNLCCYGPKQSGAPNGSPLCAWELPSCLSLSGRQLRSSDSLVKEIFSTEEFPLNRKQHKKNVVAGFSVIPSTLKLEPAGFSVVRLMLSGKLEMQNYHASWDSYIDRSNSMDEGLVKQKNSFTCCMNQEGSVSTRFRYLKFQHLYKYICGDLTNALARHVPKSNKRKTNPNSLSPNLVELSKRLKSSSISPASFISDAGIPTSILEIASRKVLAGLKQDMLSMAFSKYSDLRLRERDSSFEFLEVPSSLPHHSLPPFFVVKPSMRSEKWTKNAPAGKALVGPILPLPVLVALQEIEKGENTPNTPTVIGVPNDDSMTHQCKMILENVFPEISIADGASGWDADQEAIEDKPFFVYEPTRLSLRSSCRLNGGTKMSAVKQEDNPVDPLEQTFLLPDAAIDDKKHTTFICGIADKTSPDPVGESDISDMLNLSTMRLDFDPLALNFQTQEKEVYMCLKKQFTEWQKMYEPYENFCTSFNIPKLPP